MAGEREKDKESIRCPSCGTWAARMKSDGEVEINCSNKRCKASLLIKAEKGETMVRVLTRR